MASDRFDDIEIIEVVSLAPKCKTEPAEQKTLQQSHISQFFASNKDNLSSCEAICLEDSTSNHTVNENGKAKCSSSEAKCSSSAATTNIMHSSSVPLRSENGESSNTAGSDTEEQVVSDGESSSIKALKKFILKWRQLKGDQFGVEDSKIENKLWKSYSESSLQYRSCQKFLSALAKGTTTMREKTIYLFIKEIVDKLKHYKDCPKITSVTSCKDSNDSDIPSDEATELKAAKTDRKLQRLQKEMKKISEQIQELDEEEVDFSDETDSAYLKQDWLQKQLIRMNNHYCKLLKCSTKTGRATEKKFRFNGTRYPEINKRISWWVNKKKCFPDYTDIQELVKKEAQESNLPLKPEAIRIQAKEILTSVGKVLKHRRLKDHQYTINSFSKDEVPLDPAGFDTELESKLISNDGEAKDNMDKIFQHFVNKEIEGVVPEDGSNSSSQDDDDGSHHHRDEEGGATDRDYASDRSVANELSPLGMATRLSSDDCSLDSFPDLETSLLAVDAGRTTPQVDEDEAVKDEGEPISSGPLDDVVMIEDECNGVEEDSDHVIGDGVCVVRQPAVTVGGGRKLIVQEEFIEDSFSEEDSCIITDNGAVTIETVDIDTSASELDEYDSKKRRRSITPDSLPVKRRCNSPEIVELD